MHHSNSKPYLQNVMFCKTRKLNTSGKIIIIDM